MPLITRRPPPDTTGNVRHATVLTPIALGQRRELGSRLARIQGHTSPFAAIAEIHVARFAILDSLPTRRRDPPIAPLEPPYLLFGASFDLPFDVLVRRMQTAMPEACDAVWSCCRNYPGSESADDLVHYLTAHRVPSGLVFATFTAAVADIRRAIRLRSDIALLMGRTESPGSAELREALCRLGQQP